MGLLRNFRPGAWGRRAGEGEWHCLSLRVYGRAYVKHCLPLRLCLQMLLEKTTHHFSAMAMIHYPPLAAPPLPGQLRCGPHQDSGTLTIVWEDGAGLEVQLADAGATVLLHPPLTLAGVSIGM